jgi:hypothetical protein
MWTPSVVSEMFRLCSVCVHTRCKTSPVFPLIATSVFSFLLPQFFLNFLSMHNVPYIGRTYVKMLDGVCSGPWVVQKLVPPPPVNVSRNLSFKSFRRTRLKWGEAPSWWNMKSGFVILSGWGKLNYSSIYRRITQGNVLSAKRKEPIITERKSKFTSKKLWSCTTWLETKVFNKCLVFPN